MLSFTPLTPLQLVYICKSLIGKGYIVLAQKGNKGVSKKADR